MQQGRPCQNHLLYEWDECHGLADLHSAPKVRQPVLQTDIKKKDIGIMQDRTNNTGGPVSDLIVLTFGQLYEELCNLMLNLHLPQDGCAIICNSDLAVR